MHKLLFPLLILLGLSLSNLAHAQSLSAVDAGSCNKMQNSSAPFILVLKHGEEVGSSITHCMKQANISSAYLTGLGMLENPTLGYFNMKSKQYQYKKFPGRYELLSLQGNITQMNSKPFAHIHVTLSNERYNAFGGHLKDANVGATAEIMVIPFTASIQRKFDPITGANLIATSKND